MPPSLALPLFFFSVNILYFYVATKFIQFTEQATASWISLSQTIFLGCIVDLVLYWFASSDYSNPVFKVWMILVTGVMYIIGKVYLFLHFLLKKKRSTQNKVY